MTKFNDIAVQTDRLLLIPLSYPGLLKYANLDYTLEKELGLKAMKREITEEFKDTIDNYLVPYLQDKPEHLYFATIWIIVLKSENIIVGDIGFNAGPSQKGVIEIGYSTYAAHMKKGYMTEALKALTNWAFLHPDVNIIIAQTDKTNLASQTVSKRNFFTTFVEVENSFWWRLDRNLNIE